MVEIEPRLPKRNPRQRIKLCATRSFRKHGCRDRDMSLEHASEAIAHLLARIADGDRAGDIGGSVFVLGARIDEEYLARLDATISLARHAIMRDGAIGSRA